MDHAALTPAVSAPTTDRTFAFLVHPRAAVAPDMGRVWRPLGHVPEGTWQWAMRHVPIPPLRLATVYRPGLPPSHDTGHADLSHADLSHAGSSHVDPGDVDPSRAHPEQAANRPLEVGPDPTHTLAGHVLVVPVGAKQLLAEPRRWVRGKIEEAIDQAERLGASIVGLGALTAPVTGAGRLLRPRPGVSFTTGNAYTALLTHEALHRLLPAARGGHVAVIGATGSVGSCVVRLLADEPVGGDLTLIAREPRRLETLAGEVRELNPALGVRTATDLAAARDADIVVVLTSATDALLRSEHLAPGAVVLDDTQPRNTDLALATERPDVLVVDGGVANVSGLEIHGDIGLPRGLAYACLCETMLMAFDEIPGDATGPADVAHARRLRTAARRFAHLGFHLADPALSFGRPVPWPSEVAPWPGGVAPSPTRSDAFSRATTTRLQPGTPTLPGRAPARLGEAVA